MTVEPLVYTIPEVAARLAISRDSVYRLVKSHALRAVRVNSVLRVPIVALDEFLATNEQVAS